MLSLDQLGEATLTVQHAFERLDQATTRAELRAVKEEIERHDHAGTLLLSHVPRPELSSFPRAATRLLRADAAAMRRIYDRYNVQLTRLPA